MSRTLAKCLQEAAADKHDHDRLFISPTFALFLSVLLTAEMLLQKFVQQTAEGGEKLLGLKCKQLTGKSRLKKRKIIKRHF